MILHFERQKQLFTPLNMFFFLCPQSPVIVQIVAKCHSVFYFHILELFYTILFVTID